MKASKIKLTSHKQHFFNLLFFRNAKRPMLTKLNCKTKVLFILSEKKQNFRISSCKETFSPLFMLLVDVVDVDVFSFYFMSYLESLVFIKVKLK